MRNKEKVETFVFGMMAVPVLWFMASVIDVLMHNLSTCTYAGWNLFSLFF